MSKSSLISIDARAAIRGLSKIGEAAAFGTARGLNDVAFQALRFERTNMSRRLDRPSRFTISGTQVERVEELRCARGSGIQRRQASEVSHGERAGRHRVTIARVAAPAAKQSSSLLHERWKTLVAR